MADVTDAMFDGYIANFFTTYVRKVGRTSDEMYKACFSAYMRSEHSTLHKISVLVQVIRWLLSSVVPSRKRVKSRR